MSTTPPPVIPPPILSAAPAKQKIPTFVYILLSIPMILIEMYLAYGQALVHYPGNFALIQGYVMGAMIVPGFIVLIIASCWKKGRNFRGVVKISFWVLLFMLVVQLNTVLTNPQRSRSVPESTGTPAPG
jgi:hypothetical protein